jgi:hypothetical protein
MQPISPEAKKQQELRTAQRSNDPKLAAVDRLLWGVTQRWLFPGRAGATMCRRYCQRLLQGASFSLHELSITFSPSKPLALVCKHCPVQLLYKYCVKTS